MEKLFIETGAEDMKKLLRATVKHKGSLDSWFRKFQSLYNITPAKEEYYLLAIMTLFKMDEFAQNYRGSDDALNEELQDAMDQLGFYCTILKWVSIFRESVKLYEINQSEMAELVKVSDQLLEVPFDHALFSRNDKFAIRLPGENDLFIGHQSADGRKERVTEIYFSFVENERVQEIIKNAHNFVSAETANYAKHFDRIVQVLLVANSEGPENLYFEELIFPLGQGLSVYRQFHMCLYEQGLPLEVEETLRNAINIALRIGLFANSKEISTTESLSMTELKLIL